MARGGTLTLIEIKTSRLNKLLLVIGIVVFVAVVVLLVVFIAFVVLLVFFTFRSP